VKKILSIAIAIISFGFSETNSVDITMGDLKEATSRLIKDVQTIKKAQAKPMKNVNKLIAELKEKQKGIVLVKEREDKNDIFIRNFISQNKSYLLTK